MVTRRLTTTGILALLTAIAAPAASAPPAPAPSWFESRWGSVYFQDLGLFFEASAGPVGGVRLGAGEADIGYAARLGVHRGQGAHVVSSGFPHIVPELLFGETRTFEATFRVLRGGIGPARYFMGLSLTSLNFIGEYTAESRLRGPTVLGLALPEVGLWLPAGGSAAPYVSYSAPFTYLLAEHVAVELRPSLTIAFRPGPSPNDVHLWLSTALMWR